MHRTWRETGGEEDRNCDGRTVLRDLQRVREELNTQGIA